MLFEGIHPRRILASASTPGGGAEFIAPLPAVLFSVHSSLSVGSTYLSDRFRKILAPHTPMFRRSWPTHTQASVAFFSHRHACTCIWVHTRTCSMHVHVLPSLPCPVLPCPLTLAGTGELRRRTPRGIREIGSSQWSRRLATWRRSLSFFVLNWQKCVVLFSITPFSFPCCTMFDLKGPCSGREVT